MTGSIAPSRARSVRSTPYFSKAWNEPSGSADVTLRSPPRTTGNASTSASVVAPAATSRSPTSVPGAARAANRCSVDRNSSPPARMICSPLVTTFATARDSWGWATVAPFADGSLVRMAFVLAPSVAASAPTARSRPGAVDPSVDSSAASRWAGSTMALPAAVAAPIAAASTSRLLVVRMSVFMSVVLLPFCAR